MTKCSGIRTSIVRRSEHLHGSLLNVWLCPRISHRKGEASYAVGSPYTRLEQRLNACSGVQSMVDLPSLLKMPHSVRFYISCRHRSAKRAVERGIDKALNLLFASVGVLNKPQSDRNTVLRNFVEVIARW